MNRRGTLFKLALDDYLCEACSYFNLGNNTGGCPGCIKQPSHLWQNHVLMRLGEECPFGYQFGIPDYGHPAYRDKAVKRAYEIKAKMDALMAVRTQVESYIDQIEKLPLAQKKEEQMCNNCDRESADTNDTILTFRSGAREPLVQYMDILTMLADVVVKDGSLNPSKKAIFFAMMKEMGENTYNYKCE